jgi:hypothetical protein
MYRRSILDLVNERTSKLASTLGPTDRRKLDEYLTSIREIEQRIEKAEKDMTGLTPTIDKPTGVPVLYADYVNLMFDLQLIRVPGGPDADRDNDDGREGSMRTYPELGVPDPHHPLTHHRGNPEWIERVTKINTLHMELFAGFIKKMKETPDGDGSLLDHSIIVYGSGLSDGNRHTHEDLPIAVIGHGGGLPHGKPHRVSEGTRR